MILSNVNIGTGPSSGDGDPLRVAFAKIDDNFQIITNNVNALTNSVSSVAGRSGTVILTVNDVIGAASIGYVNSMVGVAAGGNASLTSANISNTLTVGGISTFNGASTFNGDSTFNGTSTVNGTAIHEGNVVVSGHTTNNGSTDLFGNVDVYGVFKIHSDGIGSQTAFTVDTSGLVNITVPVIPVGKAGLNLIGSSTGAQQVPTNAGTLMQLTNEDNQPGRISLDSFGTGNVAYSNFAFRTARGTASIPHASQSGDLLSRISTNAWGATGFASVAQGIAHINVFANENFTDTNHGTRMEFRLTPIGLASGRTVLTLDGSGAVVAGNLTIVQTTTFTGPSVFNGLITSNGGRISNGDTVFNGNLLVNGDTNFVGHVSHTGDTQYIGNLDVSNGLTVQGNLTIEGTTTTIGELINIGNTAHTGDTTFNGNTTHNGAIIVNGDMIVTGNTTRTGSVVDFGARTQNGPFIVNGNTTHTGSLTVTGNTALVGEVDVTGATMIAGNIIATGATSFNGYTTFTGPTEVDGNLEIIGDMSISNQVTFTGTGYLQFNDGTQQTSAAVNQINNTNHIVGSFGQAGNIRTLNLTSDATNLNTPSTLVARNASGNIAVGQISATGLQTTSLVSNSSIAGSLTVFGNLNVVGTTTTTQAIIQQLGTKTFTVAGNATVASQADGGGFLVGNISGVSAADWTFDYLQTAWRSNISIVPAIDLQSNIGSASRQWNTVHVDAGRFYTEVVVGATPNLDFTDSIGQFTGNANAWVQVSIQNISSGPNASSDLVASADNGDDTVNYIDVGINSSQYTNTDYSIGHALDGYLYTNGGNLTIGTQSLQKAVIFHTGGTTADREAGRIEGSGQRWLIGTPTDDGVNRLQVNDGIRATGNITASRLVSTVATGTAPFAIASTTKVVGLNVEQVDGFDASQAATANTIVVRDMNGTINTVTLSATGNITSPLFVGNIAYSGVQGAPTTVSFFTNDANYANTTQVNTSVTTANTAMKGYVDSTVASNVSSVNSTITTANTAMKGYVDNSTTTANTAMKGYVDNSVTTANVALKGYVDQSNTAMKGYADAITTAWTANANTQQTSLNTLFANAATQSDLIIAVNANVTQANIAMKGYVDNTVAQANVGLAGTVNGWIASNVSTLNNAITAANVGMKGYVDNSVSTANIGMKGYVDQTNVAMKGYVDNAVTSVATYSNVQVAAFLPTYTGNIGTVSNANVAMKGYVDNAVTSANVGMKGYVDNQITGVNSSITLANTTMKGYVDGQITAANAGAYSNVKVSTYLQNGNIANISVAGNITATYHIGNGSALTNVAAATAQTAVTVTGNAQANITSVGTLSSLTVSGITTHTGNVNIAGNVTITTGELKLTAGTTTIAPLTFMPGVLETTAGAGDFEFDGNVLYATPSDSQRGVIAAEQFYSLGIDRTFAPGSATQTTMFGVAPMVTTGTRYHFAIKSAVNRSAGGGSTLRLGFSGNAVLGRVAYYAVTNNSGGITMINVNATGGFTVGNAITLSGASGTAAVMEIFGTIDVTTGGNLQPTIGFGVTPGTVTVPAGSLMRIYPISTSGSGNTAVGTWA